MQKYKTYPRGMFRRAAQESRSWRQLARKLGMHYTGTACRILPRIANQLDVDTSHFKGMGWRAGIKAPNHRTLDETLIVSNSHPDPGKLIKRIVAAGLKQRKCNRCGLDSWLGQPIPLILAHKNADPRDYTLPNLEFMCPNCHRTMMNDINKRRGGSKNAKYSGKKAKKSIGK